MDLACGTGLIWYGSHYLGHWVEIAATPMINWGFIKLVSNAGFV